jgi:uncharacterized membrane protein
MQIAQFINLILLTLVTGVFWGTWFSLSRTIESISPSTFLEVGKMMIVNLGGPMSILMPSALLSTLPVLYFMYRQRRTRDLALVLLGLLFFVVALVGTLTVNVPIDRQINDWTLATLPSDWMQIRDRWEFWHTIRTFASLAGLACVLASTLHMPDLALSGSPRSKRPQEPSGSITGYGSASARRV